MRVVTKAFLRYLRRRRSLSLLQLLGIACGVAAAVGMALSARVSLSSFEKAVEFLGGQATHSLERPAGPVEEMKDSLSQIWPSIADEELIILYCYGPACGSADMVSEYLRGEGFTNTRVYSPGWQTLAKAKDLQ